MIVDFFTSYIIDINVFAEIHDDVQKFYMQLRFSFFSSQQMYYLS